MREACSSAGLAPSSRPAAVERSLSKMELKQNAPILAANGDAVGHLDRVVVNPETKVITHIVVQTGGLVKKEGKVVPLSLIAEATDEQIKLRDGAGDLQQMQSFEEKQYVMQGDASTGAA